jgi:hypothetical protein
MQLNRAYCDHDINAIVVIQTVDTCNQCSHTWGYQSHIFGFERLQHAKIDKRHIQN